jgi:hypothetical protein
MKRRSRILILLLLAVPFFSNGQIFSTSKGAIRLEGVAQQETIVAESKSLDGKLDISTRKFNFRQSLSRFSFSQGELQKKDAEEKYWEVDKYPYATFKGMIINDIDFTKEGDYEVTAKGILTMHGVDRDAKMSLKLKVKDGTIAVHATFKIFLSDYNIKIPRLVVLKVSEVFEANCVFLLRKSQTTADKQM